MDYISVLSKEQRSWLERFFSDNKIRTSIETFEGILYLLRTGCQWRLLPPCYGNWKTVYHHFRSLDARGWIARINKKLLTTRRQALGLPEMPTTAILDSQSTRCGLPESVKGIDGNKRIKGIKRHIAVDRNGLPLAVAVTAANVHDSKGACPLVVSLMADLPTITELKADHGYRGKLVDAVKTAYDIELKCVKSNHGTSDFIPIEGRWVVERTIAWLDRFRRLARNYERFLHTAAAMTRLAFLSLLLKHV